MPVFRWLIPTLVLILALLLSAGQYSANAQAPRAPGPPEEFVPGQILVGFEPGASGREVADAHRRNGSEAIRNIPRIDVQVVRVPRGQEQEFVERFLNTPNAHFAELDSIAEALDHMKPDDSKVGEQWQYNNTGQTGGTSGADMYAFEAWHTILGSNSVPIAILDTGIRSTHEDLTNKVTKSKSFATCGSFFFGGSTCAVDDKQGHGTHVAGSAAANTNNELGVAGTCRDCPLFNVKVLNDNGSGAISGIANGIIWAADEGAKVISMSLGGSSGSQALEDAVNYAWGTKPDGSDSGKRAVIVAAAGNDGMSDKSYPGAYENGSPSALPIIKTPRQAIPTTATGSTLPRRAAPSSRPRSTRRSTAPRAAPRWRRRTWRASPASYGRRAAFAPAPTTAVYAKRSRTAPRTGAS